MLGYRTNDAVLTICQNNAEKSIEIIALNDAACILTGYGKQEVTGWALAAVVPSRVASLLKEYVEYKSDANDVGAVLSKMQNFTLLTRDQAEKNFRMKLVRGESTKHRLTFFMVLQDAIHIRKHDALRQAITESFKGHEVLDAVLGVPSRKSLEKDIELASFYHGKAELIASFVMIQPDHLEALEKQYGTQYRSYFLKHIAAICRKSLRPDDVIGVVDDKKLGILLLDSESDATRMVANRLRWQIAANPFILPDNTSLTFSASMVYANINAAAADHMLEACGTQMDALPEDATGQLLEAEM